MPFPPLSQADTVTLPLNGSDPSQIVNAGSVSVGAWQTLSMTGFATATGGFGSVRYRLEGTDVLRFEGRAAASTTYTASAVIATLPAGYRPSVKRSVMARSTSTANAGIELGTDGGLSYTAGVTSGQFISFDGVTIDL